MTDSPIENRLHDALEPAPHVDDVARAAIHSVSADRDGGGVEVPAGALDDGEQSPVEQALTDAVPGHGAGPAPDFAVDLAFTNPTEVPGR